MNPNNPPISQDGLTREQIAIRNVRAFAIFTHDKLPKHVSEDLLIVVKLAEEASQ